MKLKVAVFCLALFAPLLVAAAPRAEETVEGVAVDITNAKIANATVVFWSGAKMFTTKTISDGKYSIRLRPGTYTASVSQGGFCTYRRAPFVVKKHSSIRFNFQLWVCPSDVEFIHYEELNEVRHTHLKPLILFASKDSDGDLQRFHGPTTDDDGTGHARKYPAVLTFNLLTLTADEIDYNPFTHLVTASGHVIWNDGTVAEFVEKLETKLDNLNPRFNR